MSINYFNFETQINIRLIPIHTHLTTKSIPQYALQSTSEHLQEKDNSYRSPGDGYLVIKMST